MTFPTPVILQVEPMLFIMLFLMTYLTIATVTLVIMLIVMSPKTILHRILLVFEVEQ